MDAQRFMKAVITATLRHYPDAGAATSGAMINQENRLCQYWMIYRNFKKWQKHRELFTGSLSVQ